MRALSYFGAMVTLAGSWTRQDLIALLGILIMLLTLLQEMLKKAPASKDPEKEDAGEDLPHYRVKFGDWLDWRYKM